MIKLYALNYGVNTFLFLFNSGGGGVCLTMDTRLKAIDVIYSKHVIYTKHFYFKWHFAYVCSSSPRIL